MKTRLSAAALALACLPLAWAPAMAQNSLTVPMEIEQISNPGLAPQSQGSVTVYRIHPEYTWQTRQGNSHLDLSVGALIEKSSNTALSPDRTLPSVRMLWERTGELSTFQLRASVEEASTRQAQFAQFGQAVQDSKQRTETLGSTWIRDLSAGSALELGASYSRVSFDSPLFTPYSEARGTAVYRFESGANSRYSLSTYIARLDAGASSQTTAQTSSSSGVALGYETDLSERLTLHTKGGAVYTSALVKKIYPVGELRLTYQGARASYSLAWVRDVGPDAATGSYMRFENVDASMTYPLSVDTTLSLGVNRARSLGGTDGSAGAGAYTRLRTELNRFWAFTAGLAYRQTQPSGGLVARGNSVTLGLIYTHPDF